MAPIGAWRRKYDGVHGGEQQREVVLAFARPGDAIRDSKATGPVLERGLEFAMAYHQNPASDPGSGRGVQEGPETSSVCQFSNHADDRYCRVQPQPVSGPPGVRSGPEAILDRYGNRRHGASADQS